MGMAAVIYKKGAPDNFVWEEIKVGTPERGQVRLRSTAVGVNFADTYHRAGIPHPMIVGNPPVVVGFEGVGEIEELGPGVTGFSVGERVCTCLPPLGAYSQERLYPADKLIKVPKDLPLDDVQLAGLILKGMTAQYLLHRTRRSSIRQCQFPALDRPCQLEQSADSHIWRAIASASCRPHPQATCSKVSRFPLQTQDKIS
jgi:NADPH:quinone reductase-like Zn-dependent oxidoreductase